MIHYITGKPGAGKSYLAVYVLYYYFGIDKAVKKKLKKLFSYDHADICYTNLGELQYDKFDNVHEFDWDWFYGHLQVLYDYKVNQKYTDTELIVYLKEHKIYNAVIAYDECHEKLDEEDKVVVWWFAYHRHLHHEIILLTQDLGMVKPKYMKLTENFYCALSSTVKLGSNMIYNKYSHYRLFDKSEMKPPLSIKSVQEIFDTYKSGAENKHDNHMQNRLRYLLVMGALVFFLLYMVIKGFSSSSTDTSDVNTSKKVPMTQKELEDKRREHAFKTGEVISRVKSNHSGKIHKVAYCSKKYDTCLFEDEQYSYEMFYEFLKESDSKAFQNRLQSTNYYKIDLILPPDFFLLKGANDENNSASSSFIPTF
jgi:zona occludens toxin